MQLQPNVMQAIQETLGERPDFWVQVDVLNISPGSTVGGFRAWLARLLVRAADRLIPMTQKAHLRATLNGSQVDDGEWLAPGQMLVIAAHRAGNQFVGPWSATCGCASCTAKRQAAAEFEASVSGNSALGNSVGAKGKG